jgi:adenine-specific DNA-methyltransferase
MPPAEQKSLWEDEPCNAKPRVFRPIHYLGSKLRLIDEIKSSVDEVDPSNGPVCDLFAGSGTVAAALSGARAVTAVDVQEYSRVLCSALLTQQEDSRSTLEIALKAASSELYQRLYSAVCSLIEYEVASINHALAGQPDSLCELIEHGSILGFQSGNFATSKISRPLKRVMREVTKALQSEALDKSVTSLTTRYYGGVYFSYAQAVHLDAILALSDEQPKANRDGVIAIALSAASDVVNTVGKHFAQPVRLRKKDGSLRASLIEKVNRDRNRSVSEAADYWVDRYATFHRSQLDHRAFRADYLDFLKSNETNFNAIYADPPYTRDHYSRYYHILETMARRDVPSISPSNLDSLELSRGLYRSDRHQSPFSIKSQAPGAFQRLFEECRRLNVPLVMSYSPYAAGSHPRLLTIEHIGRLAKQSFRSVDIRSVGTFAHSKLNSSDRLLTAAEEAEVLLLCRQ